jgi:transposase
VDVAKAELVIAQDGHVRTLDNGKRAIVAWLKRLPAGCVLALEATNRYHLLLADLAHAAGHTVYVLNPQALKHDRTATGKRAKTDDCDARLLARYVEREHAHLRPDVPLTPGQRRLSRLLRRRAVVVKTTTQLRLSLEPEAKELGLGAVVREVLQAQQRLLKAIDLKAIDRQIERLLAQPEHHATAARLQSIVGVGPLSGAALLVALERGQFADADAFVAFLGLDPVPRDSGQKHGQRRLSKQGDSETRRLLFNAALSASQTPVWRPLYRGYLERGLSAIQALCILARKIARTAWSLYHHGTTFSPERLTKPLT